MSYKINKRYQELPQYKGLLELVKQGLVHGLVVKFQHIGSGASFIDEYGAIWQKLDSKNWFAINRGMNAKTQGEGGQKYTQFNPKTQVREMLFVKAKPVYSESSLDFDFPITKMYRYDKLDREFCDLHNGDYFTARKFDGIWKKIPTTFKYGRNCNAIAEGRVGLRFIWFDWKDQVKYFKEREQMTDEDYRKMRETEADLSLFKVSVKVKSQIPEHVRLGTLEISCVEFNVNSTLDEDGKKVQTIQAGIKVEDGKRRMVKLTDRLEIGYKGAPVHVVPLKAIDNGFLVTVIAGDADCQLITLRLGDTVKIDVIKAVFEE